LTATTSISLCANYLCQNLDNTHHCHRQSTFPYSSYGGAGIHPLSATADGGCQPAMAIVPYFTTKWEASDQPFHRQELQLTPHATKSEYMLLSYGLNFEENEHKQVTEYCEASTYLLSSYLFSFHCFFHLCTAMHLMAIQFNSISPISDPFGV